MSRLMTRAGARLALAVAACAAMGGPAGATATYEGRFQGFLHLAGISDSAGVALTAVPGDLLIEASGTASGFGGGSGAVVGVGSNLNAHVCRMPMNFGCPAFLASAPFAAVPLTMDLTGGFPLVGGTLHTHDVFGVGDGSGGTDSAPQSSSWGTTEISITNLSTAQQLYTVDFELVYVYALATGVDDPVDELASISVEALLLGLPGGTQTLVGALCDSSVHGATCTDAGGGPSIFVTSPPPLVHAFSIAAGPAASSAFSLSVALAGEGFSPAARPNGVPLPPTLALAALGLAALGWGRRRVAASAKD